MGRARVKYRAHGASDGSESKISCRPAIATLTPPEFSDVRGQQRDGMVSV